MILPPALEQALSSFEDGEGERAYSAKGENYVLLPSPAQPMAVARVFVQQCLHENILTLRHWRGGWWMWRASHWVEVHDGAVRSILYRFTEYAVYRDSKGEIAPWAPDRHKVSNLIDALTGICLLPNEIDQPCWLDCEAEDATIVSVKNGLLDVGRRRLLPHTPQYFNQTSVPFDYDANRLNHSAG